MVSACGVHLVSVVGGGAYSGGNRMGLSVVLLPEHGSDGCFLVLVGFRISGGFDSKDLAVVWYSPPRHHGSNHFHSFHSQN
eukprot:11794890-Heterocapsa_arctica.AAC.2